MSGLFGFGFFFGFGSGLGNFFWVRVGFGLVKKPQVGSDFRVPDTSLSCSLVWPVKKVLKIERNDVLKDHYQVLKDKDTKDHRQVQKDKDAKDHHRVQEDKDAKDHRRVQKHKDTKDIS